MIYEVLKVFIHSDVLMTQKSIQSAGATIKQLLEGSRRKF
jgi:hypothetical protein